MHRSSKADAAAQWQQLQGQLARHGRVELVEPQPGLPDLVFTANAAVVVVGDVDVAEVKRLAETTYGQIPAGVVPPRKPREEPAQTGTRRVQIKAPADQAYLALSWKVPSFTGFEPTDANRDALALTLLAAVLDGYNGARLDRALAQGEGRLADSAGASNTMSGRGPQVFMLDAVPAKGKTPE